MKQTPLHTLNLELGARTGPFAGYDMPLFYRAGILAEHRHVREAAGLFDICHMLQVEIAGPDAAALVSTLCPYAAGEQAIGRARYSFFLNERAGIIDDLIVTRLAQDRFLIVCNAGCADKDLLHIQHHAASLDVAVDLPARALIALQGPQAEAVLTALDLDVAPLRFLDVGEFTPTANGGKWLVSRSGYTGEDGFEIAMPTGEAEAFARKLLADSRVLPIGLGARDSLRLEAGLPLYGQDLSHDITPMEAGLAWAIGKSHREGGEFVGALALAQKFASGRARRRIALLPQGAAPVRAHAELTDGEGKRIGEITSGGFGPTLNAPIALGLIDIEAKAPFFAELRGRRIPVEETKLPFVPHRYKN